MQPLAPMSSAFLERPSVYQPSSNPDQAAQETIALMTSYIKGSASDPLVQNEARRAVQSYPSPFLAMSGIAGDDPRLSRAAREQAAAESCWSWAKHNLKFVHHNKLFAQWMPHFQNALQLLISPDVIAHALNGNDRDARSRARQGDCAIFTPMVCALLEALGLDWELVIAKVPPNVEEFGHVWCRVVLSDGRRVDLDASHGDYPGWHVPKRDIYGLQVFDSSGRAVADRGQTFTGLHEYIGTGFNAGLGSVCDDSGNCYDDSGILLPQPSNDPFNPSGSTNVGAPPGGWPSTPAPSNPATTNLLSSLLNQWTAIGGRVIAPQTTYTVGPNGQVSYSTPGAAPIPTGLPSSLGGSSSMIWLLGGGLVLAAFAFGGKK